MPGVGSRDFRPMTCFLELRSNVGGRFLWHWNRDAVGFGLRISPEQGFKKGVFKPPDADRCCHVGLPIPLTTMSASFGWVPNRTWVRIPSIPTFLRSLLRNGLSGTNQPSTDETARKKRQKSRRLVIYRRTAFVSRSVVLDLKVTVAGMSGLA
jgi:hypothetical protein